MGRSGEASPAAIGQYAMYGQIGAGGMATVHLGRGPAGEVVAIKRLRPHLLAEPDVVKSFLDEARLSARVRHPNVVSTLEVVTHDGEVFLVMEYFEGVSLALLLRARATPAPPVPADLAATVFSGVLRGLHAAHEAVNEAGEPLHIVHRDVSPHNILVGVDGTARVLDFGVAKALGRQQTTRDGKIKGKLGYMAPEQLSGRGVTRRTDIFAAGIVLWEALTGDRLFHTDDEATTVTRVLMERVRAPSHVCSAAPAALDAVVLRALERDPSKRFLTAEEMAHAVDLAVAPAGAAAVGWWVRSIAADELARRAVLLRAEGEPALAPDLSATDIDGSIVSASRYAPSSKPPPRKLRALAAASAVVAMALAAWGAVSVSRAKATPASGASALPVAQSAPETVAPLGGPLGVGDPLPAAPLPSASESPSAASATAAASSSAPPALGKTSTRRTGPKGAPAKAAASARERLYSRD
jgi:serine/threonine protein kinase